MDRLLPEETTMVDFDMQPTLESDLVVLRPLKTDDLEPLFAVASDPEIWAQHPAGDRCQRPVFERFFAESLASGGALAVVDAATGRIIGSSRFAAFCSERGQVEIGWSFLARSHWGGTYNREMKRLMLHHAFQFVARVVLLVAPDNLRSCRAVEKIGGVFQETIQRAHDVVRVYHIERPS